MAYIHRAGGEVNRGTKNNLLSSSARIIEVNFAQTGSPEEAAQRIVRIWNDQPPEARCFCLATVHPPHVWKHYWFERGKFGRVVRTIRINLGRNLYWCIRGFTHPRRTMKNVVPSCYMHSDLDNVHPSSISERCAPTWVLQTSPGHWQAIWECDGIVDQTLHTRFNRHIKADHCHDLTHVMRVPWTINQKAEYDLPQVMWSRNRTSLCKVSDIEEECRMTPDTFVGVEWEDMPEVSKDDGDAARKKYWHQLSGELIDQLRRSPNDEDDRSKVMFKLMRQMFEHDATANEVFAMAKYASNGWNKWPGNDEYLWEDVQRVGARDKDKKPWAVVTTRGPFSEDPAEFPDQIPDRPHICGSMMPLRKVSILGGHGETGKTTLLTQCAVAVASPSAQWIGRDVMHGGVYLFLCENDRDDSTIDFYRVMKGMGVSRDDVRGRIRVASRAYYDNILMTFKGEYDTGKRTQVFDDMMEDINRMRPHPIMVGIDTRSDTFGGNENVRMQARKFVQECCGTIAHYFGCAVPLVDHPSLTGLDGSGSSGSTGWHNSVRSRVYLRNDNGLWLEEMKSQYATSSTKAKIPLKWSNGILVPDDSRATVNGTKLTGRNAAVLNALDNALKAHGHGNPRTVTADQWRHYARDHLGDYDHRSENFDRCMKYLKRAKLITIDKHDRISHA